MLKSSRLVAITGCLLGLSVTLLPLGTHAVTITQQEVNVSATIDGYLSFAAVSHTPTTNVSSYDETNNKYYGTFSVGDHTEAFGTSRYQVSCNFLSDNDFTPDTCQHGWKVSATVTNSENDATKNYDATTHEAIMVPGNAQNAYTIKSNKDNGLTGANSNWLIKITGDTRTYQDGSTVHPVGAEYTDANNNIARDYTDFEAMGLVSLQASAWLSSLTGMFSAKNIDAMAKVKNTGNTDFLAVYDLSVKSIFDTPIYSNSDNFIVLPGTERKFTTSWAEAPLFGIFSVNFTVNALDQSRTEAHVILILSAFMVVILLLLLTSIGVWTIILLRKRKERSSRLVVQREPRTNCESKQKLKIKSECRVMQKSKKNILGFLGLAFVAAMTVFAYFLPANGAYAEGASDSHTDVIRVTVYD